MREIFFCGNSIKTNEKICGDLKQHKNGKMFIRPLNGDAISSIEVVPKTVREYAGLPDKNGKKILEGDIVLDYLGNLGFVVFERGKFVVKSKSAAMDGRSVNYLCIYIEVIGNIHDNPELLEETE